MKLNAKAATAGEGPVPDRGPEKVASGDRYREHDLLIRRFHIAGLVPSEIAVVLNSQGLRVRTWAVNETFVRARLDAMELAAHRSRTFFHQSSGVYRPRPGIRNGGS